MCTLVQNTPHIQDLESISCLNYSSSAKAMDVGKFSGENVVVPQIGFELCGTDLLVNKDGVNALANFNLFCYGGGADPAKQLIESNKCHNDQSLNYGALMDNIKELNARIIDAEIRREQILEHISMKENEKSSHFTLSKEDFEASISIAIFNSNKDVGINERNMMKLPSGSGINISEISHTNVKSKLLFNGCAYTSDIQPFLEVEELKETTNQRSENSENCSVIIGGNGLTPYNRKMLQAWKADQINRHNQNVIEGLKNEIKSKANHLTDVWDTIQYHISKNRNGNPFIYQDESGLCAEYASGPRNFIASLRVNSMRDYGTDLNISIPFHNSTRTQH